MIDPIIIAIIIILTIISIAIGYKYPKYRIPAGLILIYIVIRGLL